MPGRVWAGREAAPGVAGRPLGPSRMGARGGRRDRTRTERTASTGSDIGAPRRSYSAGTIWPVGPTVMPSGGGAVGKSEIETSPFQSFGT